jgi:hypothetical protein
LLADAGTKGKKRQAFAKKCIVLQPIAAVSLLNMVANQIEWERSATRYEETELHVVAFYKDVMAGEWAKEIFERIRSRVPRDINATPGLWRFDVLEDPYLESLATADAATAAVIIIATPGSNPLPGSLLDCVDNALLRQGPERIGLVGVFDNTGRHPSDALPAYRQLQALSRKAKLRFFSLPCENLVRAGSGEDNLNFPAMNLIGGVLSIENHSYRAWGINE